MVVYYNICFHTESVHINNEHRISALKCQAQTSLGFDWAGRNVTSFTGWRQPAVCVCALACVYANVTTTCGHRVHPRVMSVCVWVWVHMYYLWVHTCALCIWLVCVRLRVHVCVCVVGDLWAEACDGVFGPRVYENMCMSRSSNYGFQWSAAAKLVGMASWRYTHILC